MPYSLLLAAMAEPHGCQHGLLPGARSLFPTRGWPYGPSQPTTPGPGAPRGTGCSLLAEKRLSWCPVAGEQRAHGDGRKHGPTTGCPSPSHCGTSEPGAENLPQGFREGQSSGGRSGRPSSVFCSGSFAPAQASAGTATSFKIWPQTFITQC